MPAAAIDGEDGRRSSSSHGHRVSQELFHCRVWLRWQPRRPSNHPPQLEQVVTGAVSCCDKPIAMEVVEPLHPVSETDRGSDGSL